MAAPRSGVLAAAVLVAAGLGVAVLSMAHRVGIATAPMLDDYGVVPAFALLNERGSPFTREMLRGRVWVADFIFTRCAGQCPLMTERMAGIARALAQEPAVGFLSVTVDPTHDTPAVLSAHRKAAFADDPRWRFVTGDPAEVVRLTQQGFHLAVADGGPPQEPITHSVRLVLLDRAGRIRGYYDGTDADAVRRLVSDAKRLLRSGS